MYRYKSDSDLLDSEDDRIQVVPPRFNRLKLSSRLTLKAHKKATLDKQCKEMLYIRPTFH